MTKLRSKFKHHGWTAGEPLTRYITITDFTTEEPTPVEPEWTAALGGGDDDLLMEKENIAA